MTFANALFYSLLGMGVVFFALILLMAIIKIMIAIGDKNGSRDAVSNVPLSVESPLPPEVETPAPGTAGDLKLYDTDPRIAAMIMAIVSDEMQIPLNKLRFRSIREIKEED